MFLIFATGIAAFMVAGILSNYLLLEKYFIYKTRQGFIEISQVIQKQMEKDTNNIGEFIVRYGKKENIRIILLDSSLKIEEISYYKRKEGTNIPSKKIKQLATKKGNDSYICKIYERKNTSSSKMLFLTETKDGQYLLLMKNTKGVRESVTAANEFYLIIGAIVLAFALCVIAIFSDRITKPVVRMNEITKEMAALHFEQELSVKGKDEIAELACSINQMSVQLKNSINELEQDIQRRKQLIRDLSHELKTPVAVIKGYADGLRFGIAEDETTRKKYCRIIADECDRMDKMVQEMLFLSKLEQAAPSAAENIEAISIYELTEQLSERYGRIAEQKNCQYAIHNPKDIKISINKTHLEHIIDNLLGNAFKYVNDNGKIEVSIYEQAADIEFCVFNTGENIPSDKIDNLWDAFYKLDQSRKRGQGGHGIGLSIVKSTVELYGGTVFAKNRENGVAFGFRLPSTALCHNIEHKTSL